MDEMLVEKIVALLCQKQKHTTLVNFLFHVGWSGEVAIKTVSSRSITLPCDFASSPTSKLLLLLWVFFRTGSGRLHCMKERMNEALYFEILGKNLLPLDRSEAHSEEN